MIDNIMSHAHAHAHKKYYSVSHCDAYISSVVFDGELRGISFVREVVSVPAETLFTPQDKCPLRSLLVQRRHLNVTGLDTQNY